MQEFVFELQALKLNSILEIPEFCLTARANNLSHERTGICSWLKQPSDRSSDHLLCCILARANIEPRFRPSSTFADQVVRLTNRCSARRKCSVSTNFEKTYSEQMIIRKDKSTIKPLTVVWVANREIPLIDSSGVLKVIDPGILALLNGTGSVIWSANVTRSTVQDPIGQLLESGNLVVRDANDDNPEHFLWQSFDHPCDTLLPGMKLGKNFVSGLERHLSSWKSSDDPGQGDFAFRCDPQGYPQLILSNGSIELFRTGPWNGLGFSGNPNLTPNSIYTYGLVFTKEEVYYGYDLVNSSVVSSCNVGNSPVCGCLSNFVPKYPKEWESEDWSNGCVRRTLLDCHKGDGFLKYSHYKMPDTKYSWFDKNMTLRECEIMLEKLLLPLADQGETAYPMDNIGINTAGLLLKVRAQSSGILMHNSERGYNDKSQKEDLELPSFDLAVISNSINNFSIDNKLGEGGFGPVYKGMLEGGQEIAVKRLSKNSSQGIDEFKNEVICIAKLRHRNLVKLLGCCIEGEEKMLIYEYMPNKSLDYFIFDRTRSALLEWPKCFHIINGIARRLLYLHQDSILRIIHRNLKASNILLDIDMNPKISDFGVARSFGGNETKANTNRVVGTHGYMAPEYAVDGLFLVKSNVFSFGVLVLEIVSGKRNRGFYHPDHHLNLLGQAWRLYKEDRLLELINEALWDSCYLIEVLRSIHVGLLCVQQCPKDRPSMSSVVLMLGSEGPLPQAKQPGFFTERNVLEAGCSSSKDATTSANEITITMLNAR
ncbi:hypothetical protein ACSBR1_011619 [Camellia fascicularis]